MKQITELMQVPALVSTKASGITLALLLLLGSAFSVHAQNGDLSVTDVTWSPLSPALGQEVTFEITVANNQLLGGEIIQDFQLKAELSVDEEDVPGHGFAVALGNFVITDDLGPMQTTTVRTTWTASTSSGHFSLRAMVDSTNVVSESDETNNISYLPYRDLFLSSIRWVPNRPEIGEEVQLIARVSNKGTVDITDLFHVRFDINGIKVGEVLVSDTIQRRGESEIILMWTADTEDFFVTATADSRNSVLEDGYGELNNSFSMTFSVGAPDYIVEDIRYDMDDSGWGYKAVIRNLGAGSVRTTKVRWYFDGVEREETTIAGLVPGESTETMINWRFGDTIRVVCDAGDDIKESDETRNDRTESLERPDMIVGDIWWTPAAPLDGEDVTFFARLDNIGKGGASQDFNVRFMLDTATSQPILLGDVRVRDDIMIGQRDLIFANADFESGEFGTSWTVTGSGSVETRMTHGNQFYARLWQELNNSSSSLRSNNFNMDAEYIEFSAYVDGTNDTDYHVRVRRSSDNEILRDVTYAPTGSWSNYVVDMTSLSGEDIYLEFECRRNGNSSASVPQFFIDDIRMVSNPSTVISVSTASHSGWLAVPGPHSITCAVDHSGELVESNEHNQELTKYFSGSLPDYLVEDIRYDTDVSGWGYKAVIRNHGADSVRSTKVHWFLDGVDQAETTIDGLAFGASTEVMLNWQFADSVHVVCDFENVVEEYNETNNGRTEMFERPDLVVGDIWWDPPAPLDGEIVTFHVQVDNIGQGGSTQDFDVRFTVDAGTPEAIVLGTARVSDDILIGQRGLIHDSGDFETGAFGAFWTVAGSGTVEHRYERGNMYSAHLWQNASYSSSSLRSESFVVKGDFIEFSGYISGNVLTDHHVRIKHADTHAILKDVVYKPDGSWKNYVVDVAELSGQNVYIEFECRRNNDMPASLSAYSPHFYIDDIRMASNPSAVICFTATSLEGWVANPGNHSITVEVNFNNEVIEAFDDNNLLSKGGNGWKINDDFYTVDRGRVLSIPPPGLLGNDAPLGSNFAPMAYAASSPQTSNMTLTVPNPFSSNATVPEGSFLETESTLLTAHLMTEPDHGALVLNTDGSFTYLHDGNDASTDSFRYVARSGVTESEYAMVYLSVTPAPTPVLHPEPIWTSGSLNTLFWEEYPGALEYILEYSTSTAFTYVNTLVETSLTLMTTIELQDGEEYWYRLQARTIYGYTSDWSNITSSGQDAGLPTGSLMINHGDIYTSSSRLSLHISAEDTGTSPSGVDAFRLRLPGGTWRDWETYVPLIGVEVTGTTGSVSIEAELRDTAGNISSLLTDNIWIDKSTPPAPDAPSDGGADYTKFQQVEFSWEPVSDIGGSGIRGYIYQVATDLQFSNMLLEGLANGESILADVEEGSSAYCRVRAVDHAGNISEWSEPSDGIIAGTEVIYVNQAVEQSGNGTSWAKSKKTIQEALAYVHGSGFQIWIAGGNYAEIVTISDMEALCIIGGFHGTESSISERNLATDTTFLTRMGSNVLIINNSKDIRIQDVSVKGNLQVPGGPAVLLTNSGGENIFVNLTVQQNASATDGGGIACLSSNLLIQNSRIVDNLSAGNGGGIFASDHSDMKIENCTIEGNRSTMMGGGGGGVSAQLNSALKIHASLIKNNSAVLNLKNTAVENQNGSGGGVACIFSTPVITDSVFENNSAAYGGGIGIAQTTSGTVTNCMIKGNVSLDGGGLYLSQSGVIISRCDISGNIADGLEAETVIGGTDPGSGGGICLNESDVNILNCTFSKNGATLYGAGIFCYNSSPVIRDCYIDKNGTATSTPRWGGGVAALLDEDYAKGVIPSLINCVITENSSSEYGGGIGYLSASGLIINCTVVHNDATDGGGGIAVIDNSAPAIINTIFAENSNYAIYESLSSEESLPDSDPELSHCLFFDNPEGHYYDEGTLGYTDIETLAIQLPTAINIIGGNPRFLEDSGTSYAIENNSAAIDTGTEFYAPSLDILGKIRPIDVIGQGKESARSAFDIGAYEFQETGNISVEPNAIHFGEEPLSAPESVFRTLVISNNGEGTLLFTPPGISLSGENAIDFAIATPLSVPHLSPGSSTTISLSYNPTSLGAKQALLTIFTDDTLSKTVQIALWGTCIADKTPEPRDLDLDAKDDTGIFNNDNITTQSQGLTIHGEVPENSIVSLFDHEALITTCTASEFSHSGLNMDLAAGHHSIVARAKVEGLPESNNSDPLEIHVDNIPPYVLEFTATTPSLPGSDTVSYTLRFSEPISGFTDPSDIRVHTPSPNLITYSSITLNQMTPSEYLVTLNGMAGEGSGQIQVLKNAFLDMAGNYNASDSILSVPFERLGPPEMYSLFVLFDKNAGAVEIEPLLEVYTAGSTVTLTAKPDEHYELSHWSYGEQLIYSPTNTLEITMDSTKTLSAIFSPIQYGLYIVSKELHVEKTPDLKTYPYGSKVMLTATPAREGYHFTAWSGDQSSTDNPLSITILSSMTLVAEYAINQYTLDVTGANGTVENSKEQSLYEHGTTLSLTAIPDPNYLFSAWSGNVPDENMYNNPLTLEMVSNTSVTAVFTDGGCGLLLDINGEGRIEKNPDLTIYPTDSTVTITATPDPGWYFTGWSGSIDSLQNTLLLDMDSTKTLTANFKLSTCALAITSTGNGTVSLTPNMDYYDYGTTVTLSAVPEAGWRFLGWGSGFTTSTNPLTVIMKSDYALSASFEQITYSLDVVSPGTIVRDPALAKYPAGTTVTILANPTEGFTFTGWSGDAPHGNDGVNQMTVVMDSNKIIIANYEANIYKLSVSGKNGVVLLLPDKEMFEHGTTVSLTADPDEGHHFIGWSGSYTSTLNPLIVTMDSAKTLEAKFAKNTYELSVTANNGTVNATPYSTVYTHGALVTLSASPDNGYFFNGWTGDVAIGEEHNNPLILTLTSARSIVADFNPNPTGSVALTVISENGSVITRPDAKTYNIGSLIELNATPDDGYAFTGWAGDAAGIENPLIFTANSDLTIIAQFRPIVTLSLNVNGEGNVDIAAVTTHTLGSVVTIHATPDDPARVEFVSWSGDIPSSLETNDTLTLPMDKNRSVTATFVLKTYSVLVEEVEHGSVILYPEANSYPHGSTVTLTAVPDTGYWLSRWIGDFAPAMNRSNPLTIRITEETVIVAEFLQEPPKDLYTITAKGVVLADNQENRLTFQKTARNSSIKIVEAKHGLPNNIVLVNGISVDPNNSAVIWVETHCLEDVYIAGNLNKFYSRCPIEKLTCAGTIKSLTMKNTSLDNLAVGGLGSLKISPRIDSTGYDPPLLSYVDIELGKWFSKASKIVLQGAVLGNLSAKDASIGLISVSSKSYRDRLTHTKYTAFGGVASGDLLVGDIKSIVVKGGSFSPVTLSTTRPTKIMKISASALTFTVGEPEKRIKTVEGSGIAGSISVAANNLQVIVKGGDILTDQICAAGQISRIQASSKYSLGGRVGKDEVPFSLFVSGSDYSQLTLSIKKVLASTGISGRFMSGATIEEIDGTIVFTPTFRGSVNNLETQAGVIEGESWSLSPSTFKGNRAVFMEHHK